LAEAAVVVVGRAEAAAVVAEAAAVDEGSQCATTSWENQMKSKRSSRCEGRARLSSLASLTLFALGACSGIGLQAADKAGSGAKAFPTPEQAAAELIQAAEKYDVPAMLAILGPEGKDLVSSEDHVADKNRAEAFVAMAHAKESIEKNPKKPTQATLLVGEDEWPFPVPIVKRNGQWYFDSKEGLTEVLYRRIGANELDAIQICRGYVEAQREYALSRRSESGVAEYAQRLISTPGKKDGLAWRNEDGSWGGPIGEGVVRALQQGYSDRAEPFHGYYFKVLKGQGPAAPLGQMDFVVEGVMIGGFALAAAPAQYRVTGVQTFIVSHDGVVYQKDFGPNTLESFKNMDRYNPDKTWHPTEDEW
jgi:hypothetical protein